MSRWVEIEFECQPLRSVSRRDPPLDASPEFWRLTRAIQAAIDTHGTHNAYYLHHGLCRFHLLNDDTRGVIEFAFEGTVLTGTDDLAARQADLTAELRRETCPWLTQPVVDWFRTTVSHAVLAEFDRFIAAGDLERTRARLRSVERQAEQAGGFIGMDL